MALIPKKMFRAKRGETQGLLTVLSKGDGPSGVIMFRELRGSQEETFIALVDIEKWKDAIDELSNIELLREIEISEGTKRIAVVHATTAVSPFMAPGKKR